MVTILWAVLFCQSVIEFNSLFKNGELPYQAWSKGQVMLLGGLVLLCLWMVIAVKRRNIFIGAAVARDSCLDNVMYQSHFDWFHDT